jgi:hypothetical protein
MKKPLCAQGRLATLFATLRAIHFVDEAQNKAQYVLTY